MHLWFLHVFQWLGSLFLSFLSLNHNHCRDVPQFVYPVIYERAPWLLPHFGKYEYTVVNIYVQSFCVHISFFIIITTVIINNIHVTTEYNSQCCLLTYLESAGVSEVTDVLCWAHSRVWELLFVSECQVTLSGVIGTCGSHPMAGAWNSGSR